MRLTRNIAVPTILTLIVVFPAALGSAEMIVDTAWVRTFDGEGWLDYAKALAVDGFGNVYVAGLTSDSTFSFDYATVKYYPNGDTAWVRRYDGPGVGWDVVSEIATDNSSNVYVTGYSTDSTTDLDYATIRYSPDGETIWVRRYDGPVSRGDQASAMIVDDSGYVYVTGHAQDTGFFSGPNSDYATIKYHPDGDTVWVRRYDGPAFYNDRAEALAVDDLGNVYVTGASHSREAFEDYATVKYLANGDTGWVRRYDGPAYLRDEAFSVDVDGFGNVFVTGWSWNGTDYDYATIKYHPDGDAAWVRRYDSPGHLLDSAAAVSVDAWGGVYVTGSSWITPADCDYLTMKYRPNGEVAWIRRYDGPAGGADHVSAMVMDNSGNVYVTGASRGSGVSDDYATVKYDSTGLRLWVRRYNGPDDGLDVASDITVDDDGNVYVTGTSRNSGSREDLVTVKYVQTGLWRGDANKDGIIDLADLVYVINFLYKGGPAPDPLTIGDCNCNQTIELGDLIISIDYLFRDGSRPDCW
jgi:uncharacterized delta-60 repeat protein